MKFFRGVAMGLWVVTPEWIQACNDAGAWLAADDYEVLCGEHHNSGAENHGGPMRSRLQHARSDWDRPSGTSNLLEGTTVSVFFLCRTYRRQASTVAPHRVPKMTPSSPGK